MKRERHVVAGTLAGERLDKAVASIAGISRAHGRKLIDDGYVEVNGVAQKASHALREGDVVELVVVETPTPDVEAVEMDLDIVHEDDHLIVVNKPSGLIVHPARTVKEATLVHGLVGQKKRLADSGDDFRPGIVHRLDKDTSGLLVVAKDRKTLTALQNALQRREIKRTYYALVEGVLSHDKGKINAPVGRDPKHRHRMGVTAKGRESLTYFDVIERFEKHTFLRVRLESGRTHQIRVHLRYIGHPLVGDATYGHRSTDTTHGQLLHAGELSFTHPETRTVLAFSSPLPDFFAHRLDMLRETR